MRGLQQAMDQSDPVQPGVMSRPLVGLLGPRRWPPIAGVLGFTTHLGQGPTLSAMGFAEPEAGWPPQGPSTMRPRFC
jgi:hypothetical protein